MKKANITKYEMQAINFLRTADAKLSITFKDTVCGFPFDRTDKNYHNKYSVTIRRNEKTYTFSFYDSYFNYIYGFRPTKYDILASLEKYPVCGDVWDFCNEYGYTISSRDEYKNVNRIFTACNTQYNKLLKLFGADLMQELQDIN